jgi:5'-nucleotidase (lipoprotein e(P4) family)
LHPQGAGGYTSAVTRTLPVLLLLSVIACRSAAPAAPPRAAAPPPAAVPGVAPAPAPAASASPDLPTALRWAQRSAEYRANFLQTYRAATTHVERAAAGRAPGSWGIVADGDETVISNVQHEVELAREGKADAPFDEQRWTAWVRRREAPALPGAAAFLRRVHELGGRIAIVTNRSAAECDDTKANFEARGLPYDAILCRPQEGPSDKNPRFERVRTGEAFGSGPVEVLAFLGDNIRDFPGGSQDLRKKDDEAFADFGVRYFILPNPLYGSFEGNPD